MNYMKRWFKMDIPAIELVSISKSYQQHGHKNKVLHDISLNVKKGEFVTLLGESGCGKSTLLSIVGGYMEPDQGKVYVNNQLVEKPKRNCLTLFQQHNLLPWRNVRDNVALGLTGNKKEREQKVFSALKQVGLQEQLKSFPNQLSGGMKQKVAIARAFAMEPDVILMDEPFAALDTFSRFQLQDELVRLQAQKDLSILLVTHDIDEAVYLSDRIFILRSNPGEIYEVININLRKPRNRTDQQFYQIRSRILDIFKLSREVKEPAYYI